MPKQKGGRRRRAQRDVSGQVVKDKECKRVTIAIGDRVIKAPPSGPAETKQWAGHVKPVKKVMSIYAYLTKSEAQHKAKSHKIKVNNAAAKGEKYRTVFDREYIRPVSTSQYRERDKVRPFGQYNIRH
ncbi:hypothetical protein CAPTEDRAFT_213161 [Capitella teleta]|uniref:Uncharacterized protein n=1 Tax=Capitella teleta TaxID=283909 RepID=R7VBD4_CAPTE|nr:hypothetical protein CAPTEDRAFT_213161 [Capitella teleta]|eukprot:ELU15939.1 hypothetical protein CAPTEDRAFT_213161 [Capitella teleta]